MAVATRTGFETNDCFTGQIRGEDDLVAEILDVRPVEWGVATLIPGSPHERVRLHAEPCDPGASCDALGRARSVPPAL